MKPNTKYNARQIAEVDWHFTSLPDGSVTISDIDTAAMLDAARSLRSIMGNLNAIGADGIHGLIRMMSREALRRENARETRARNLRRKRRLAKKARLAAGA